MAMLKSTKYNLQYKCEYLQKLKYLNIRNQIIYFCIQFSVRCVLWNLRSAMCDVQCALSTMETEEMTEKLTRL